MGEVDFSSDINQFTFGFLYDGEQIDMLDNEYLRIRMYHEHKVSVNEKHTEEIGLYKCEETTQLKDYFD